jgi:hypothetical protein
VDDIKGLKEPEEANTGNYAGKNDAGDILPLGQPRSVTVDIKAGEYLWFAEMEDNSGGISGMIIRGLPAAAAVAVELLGSSTLGGAYATVAGATVDATAKTITIAKPAAATSFYRVKGSSSISISASGANLVIKYQ